MAEILALLTGVVCGWIFTRFNLPAPVPPTLAGFLGIVGLFLGFVIARGGRIG